MPRLDDFVDRIAIVVSSCDAFFDSWQPFAKFFAKFWPGCPFRAYLLTNHLTIQSRSIESLALGDDRGWSSNLLRALSRIPHSHILYLQEDYFLNAPVLSEQLAEDCHYVITTHADSLCFRARTQPDAGFLAVNERFGEVPLSSDGRTRCQVTLWKKDSLQSILRDGESAWDFEARGSARTQNMRILSYERRDNTPISYLMSAISRGLWMPEARALCEQHGIALAPDFRPNYSSRSWLRRWRRARGRRSLRRALAHQSGRAVEL